jgi:hypothetical protein
MVDHQISPFGSHNAQIWAASVLIGIRPAAAQNGSERVPTGPSVTLRDDFPGPFQASRGADSQRCARWAWLGRDTPAPGANPPAQLTRAAEHVTGSHAQALAGPTSASPAGQDQPISDGLGHACAELAALIPALIPALSRDSVPSALSAGRVVNPDVLHAMIILAAEIPAACAAASQVTGDPWQRRQSAICLRAIPRLHHRLTALGMPAAARDLEAGVHHWTRTVKLALGPRTPRHPRRRMTGESPPGERRRGNVAACEPNDRSGRAPMPSRACRRR